MALCYLKDSDPDDFETSPVLKELNGRMPGQEPCEQIWDGFAWPGFGETYIIPKIHVCFGGPDNGVCHVSRTKFNSRISVSPWNSSFNFLMRLSTGRQWITSQL